MNVSELQEVAERMTRLEALFAIGEAAALRVYARDLEEEIADLKFQLELEDKHE